MESSFEFRHRHLPRHHVHVEERNNASTSSKRTVIAPKTAITSGLRLLPLPGFPPITLGALWHGKPSQATEFQLKELQRSPEALESGGAGG